MNKVKVRLNICGSDYFIFTDDDVNYVTELGHQLDEKISKLVHDNTRISVTQAAILTALEYADSAKKAGDSADNLRNQIKEYLEDSARYKMEAEVARRDIERLNHEIQTLRANQQGNASRH